MAFTVVDALLAENSNMIEGGAVVWRDQWSERFKSFGYHLEPFDLSAETISRGVGSVLVRHT